jgi:hypothetical protein
MIDSLLTAYMMYRTLPQLLEDDTGVLIDPPSVPTVWIGIANARRDMHVVLGRLFQPMPVPVAKELVRRRREKGR